MGTPTRPIRNEESTSARQSGPHAVPCSCTRWPVNGRRDDGTRDGKSREEARAWRVANPAMRWKWRRLPATRVAWQHMQCMARSTNLGSDAESQCPTLGVMLDIRMASIVSTTISGEETRNSFFRGERGHLKPAAPCFGCGHFCPFPLSPPADHRLCAAFLIGTPPFWGCGREGVGGGACRQHRRPRRDGRR